MRTFINFTLLMLLSLCLMQVQAYGAFTMVRCDNGDDELLSSPGDIKLTELQAAFNNTVDTVVFVHGFNTSYSDAKSNFSTVANTLQAQVGVRNYVGFYWPSDTMPSFGTAVTNADNTGPYLVHVLSTISSWYGTSNRCIHVVSHSLGARVTLRTLQQNAARYVKWGKYFNMAGAVHKNVYFNTFNGTNLLPQQTNVYFSSNDWVLKYFYTLYYDLFDRNVQDTDKYAQWQQMSVQEKIEYMKNLEAQYEEGKMPRNDFDMQLYAGIQRAAVEAMGYVGADLVSKVANIEMTNSVDGHSYWQSSDMLNKIAAAIK